MTVQINYKSSNSKKISTNHVLFVDEKYNISGLKKYFSNSEFSYISDLLKNSDLKKDLLVFEINSKKTIFLVSIRKNIKTSEIENLGAKFHGHIRYDKKNDYLVNSDTGSLGKLTLASDITGSITSTGSFGSLVSPGLSTLGIVTTSEILNNTGTLKVSQSVSDGDIEISVNDGGTTTKALIIDGSDAGSVILGNNLRMADNQKIRLGTANDFNLYHDGSHTYVENDTGHILMRNKSHGNKIHFGTENSSGVLEYVLNVTGTHSVGIGTSVTVIDRTPACKCEAAK